MNSILLSPNLYVNAFQNILWFSEINFSSFDLYILTEWIFNQTEYWQLLRAFGQFREKESKSGDMIATLSKLATIKHHGAAVSKIHMISYVTID